MSAPTVNRRDITLEEQEVETEHSFLKVAATACRWTAGLNGRLSTGEEAHLERWGPTSAEALANLEAAIAENGWEIK